VRITFVPLKGTETPKGNHLKKKIVAILQARMGSTRLLGKSLIDICGKPLVQRVIERVGYSKLIDDLVVATTEKHADDVIVELCRDLGAKYFRGSEDDVLDRYYCCAKRFNVEIVVRVTADDPFKDPVVIDKVIGALLESHGLDYVSNTIKPTFPDGLDIEVFTCKTLEKAWKEATRKSDREHVTPYIWRNPNIFKIRNIENNVDLSHLRWTLDTSRDLEFAREIYSRFSACANLFLMDDILNLLEREPWLANINAGVERNEGYKKSIAEENVV